jgi:hypothetical protein
MEKNGCIAERGRAQASETKVPSRNPADVEDPPKSDDQ